MRRFLALVLMAGGLGLMAAGCATVRSPSRSHQAERMLLTTGYCPCRTCCGWHRNWLGRPVYSDGVLKGRRKAVGVTASGTKARHGTIAADASRYPFGTVLHIPGYGHGRVEDRGVDIRGDHIDLFFESHREALQWGRRYCPARIWFP